MTLNKADYTAEPRAWYVTRTVFEPVRQGASSVTWRMKSRSGGLPVRDLVDARGDVAIEAGNAIRDEGYHFADYGFKQHGVRTIYLEKTELGAGYPQDRRIEIALVSGRERQVEIDDDLRDRYATLDKAGKHHWGVRWDDTLQRCLDWAQQAGLDVEWSPFVRTKVAHLAWERCNDVDHGLERAEKESA